MIGLTEKQREFLDSLKFYIAENGYAPTVRELGDINGITVRASLGYLEALQKKGFINRKPGAQRAISVVRH